MLDIATCLKYYSRKEILDELLYNAQYREVVAKFNEAFGKRPDIIKYPQDILTLVKAGATSFHCSQELWKNPLQLATDKRGLEELRVGWDIIIDIDCKIWGLSKLVTYLIIRALQKHGITDISCKYSGNKGFHIGIPFEAFLIAEKIQNQEIKALFPYGTKKVLVYLAHYINRKENDFELSKLILSKYTSMEIANLLNVEPEKLFKRVCSECFKETKTKAKRSEEITCPICQELNQIKNSTILACKKCGYSIKMPDYKIKDFCKYCKANHFIDKIDTNYIMGIDTILISPRHLFRMPYSLHETTGLCSLPIKPEDILGFEKSQATPENVKANLRFLYKENIGIGQGKNLIIQAYDFAFKPAEDKPIVEKNYEIPQKALSINTFPPCIKLILQGLSDGRKRALFILINFLTSLNWDTSDIKKLIKEWNSKNKELLPENYIESQLNYRVYNKKKILPPNCKNLAYYVDIGVCKPDNLCTTIKNPVNYAKKKFYFSKK